MISNDVRKQLGLQEIQENWSKIQLNETAGIYIYNGKLIKYIETGEIYREIDFEILLDDKNLIIGRTGSKPRLLTKTNILKNKTKKARIKIQQSIGKCEVKIGINHMPVVYFDPRESINEVLSQILEDIPESVDWKKKLQRYLKNAKIRYMYKDGDIFSFPVAENKYGFALITGSFQKFRKCKIMPEDNQHFLRLLMGVPVVVRVFDYISSQNYAPLEILLDKPLLNPECLMDDDVLRGRFFVFAHKKLVEDDILFPMSFSYNGKTTTYAGYEPGYVNGERQKRNDLLILKNRQDELTVRFDWGFGSKSLDAASFLKRTGNQKMKFHPYASSGGGPRSFIQYILNSKNNKKTPEKELLVNPGTIFSIEELKVVFESLNINCEMTFDDFNTKYGGMTRKDYCQWADETS